MSLTCEKASVVFGCVVVDVLVVVVVVDVGEGAVVVEIGGEDPPRVLANPGAV